MIFAWRDSCVSCRSGGICWTVTSSSCSTPSPVTDTISAAAALFSLSLSDFLIFKEMFVDFSLMKRQEGIQGADLSDILSVSSVSGR